MYYHSCLLYMFRPFIGLTLKDPRIRPQDICIQATQSVLALAQAYDDLFTLRRVPGLMPYFVCASGLFALAMEDGGLVMDPVHLRVGNNGSQLFRRQSLDGETVEAHRRLSTPLYVRMSAAFHARLLLAKMCATHPAAAVAETMLREASAAEESPSSR